VNVELTHQAEMLAVAASAWWRENRLSAPTLFDRELADALELLSAMPNVGVPYPARARYRRLLLQETDYHVYYRIDEAAGVLYVVSIWHARRGQNPKL
jgi:plasmid stabilization system protein ParE